MSKEDVLTWLTQLGTGWVGLAAIYYAFEDKGAIKFWDDINEWHDGAYITKRHNTANYEKHISMSIRHKHSIEQYKLTKKAIDSLNE